MCVKRLVIPRMVFALSFCLKTANSRGLTLNELLHQTELYLRAVVLIRTSCLRETRRQTVNWSALPVITKRRSVTAWLFIDKLVLFSLTSAAHIHSNLLSQKM